MAAAVASFPSAIFRRSTFDNVSEFVDELIIAHYLLCLSLFKGMLHFLSLFKLVNDVLCAFLSKEIGAPNMEGNSFVLFVPEERIINKSNQVFALNLLKVIMDLLS